jgi:arginyl-tRNA synthetase
MSNIHSHIQNAVAAAVKSLYGEAMDASKVQVNTIPSDFSGDFSVVVFPFVRFSKKAPDATAQEIGVYVAEKLPQIEGFDVVKGFLNLNLSPQYWIDFLGLATQAGFGRKAKNGRKVMVEFSSPNTNKPLHLGHIRNNLLGWSCAHILEALGYEVIKVQVINDRGVAICKSMLAWLEYGAGKTPESAGIKGDHFVGDYYVMFEKNVKAEYMEWAASAAGLAVFQAKKKENDTEESFFSDYKNKWFVDHSHLGAEIRAMLLKWEAGDPETIALWKKMNNWVYAGFEQTYKALGVSFDKLYYESDTYLLGKEIVHEGLEKGVFEQKSDGSIVFDLSDMGQDQKVMLRADGTAMYITQDLGTARLRYQDYGCERSVYVVAHEQDYHFQVLFEALKRLGEPYAEGLHHLSYGLVELPTGRMKTREGTSVDADDLMAEVIRIASEQANERGESEAIMEDEKQENFRKVGLAALKFFIIKVNPKKKMIFNPEESVDMKGQTGPYIQYSCVRILNILRKSASESVDMTQMGAYSDFAPEEKDVLVALHGFPTILEEAGDTYDPSLIANFCYDLAKKYHRFYHEHRVLQAESEAAKAFRLTLSKAVGQVLQESCLLLGIEVPTVM